MAHPLRYNVILFLLCLAVGGCSRGAIKKGGAEISGTMSPGDRQEAQRLISGLDAENRAAAASISARFHIDGVMNRKKLKIMGTAAYDRKSGKMHIAVVDYIFRSPLMTVFRDGDTVRFYYPVEKKIFIDSFSNIDLRRYSNLDIPFESVYSLLTGSIPVIPDYSIRKCLARGSSGGSYLILENDEYYETIFFKKNLPGKLLLVKKSDRSRYEFHLDKRMRENGSVYYRKMTMISEKDNVRLVLVFDSVALNRPVSVRTIDSVKTGPDVELINVAR